MLGAWSCARSLGPVPVLLPAPFPPGVPGLPGRVTTTLLPAGDGTPTLRPEIWVSLGRSPAHCLVYVLTCLGEFRTLLAPNSSLAVSSPAPGPGLPRSPLPPTTRSEIFINLAVRPPASPDRWLPATPQWSPKWPAHETPHASPVAFPACRPVMALPSGPGLPGGQRSALSTSTAFLHFPIT